ncbi:MAG: LysR family transcriptional regulator [Bdellovibrionales bacterium]
MNRIPVYLLESFVVVGESTTLVEAAQRLGLTQPALSKQLQTLESLLPLPPFAFQGRKKMLTSFGRDLHAHLKDRLGGLQEIVCQTVSLHSDPSQVMINIAARREILDRITGSLMFAGDLNFIDARNEIVVRSIRARKADIGIVHHVPETHELVARPLFKDHFVVAMPKSLLRKLPPGELIPWPHFKNLPCIGYRRPDEILESVCEAYGVNPRELNMTRSTSNYMGIARMVIAGLGWAVIPTHVDLPCDQVWSLPLPSKVFPPRQFFAIYRPEIRRVAWLTSLLSELERCFSMGSQKCPSIPLSSTAKAPPLGHGRD